jgi:threonine/homoserine/homoserine lactone efflux protein
LISYILVGRKTSEAIENTGESSFGEGQAVTDANMASGDMVISAETLLLFCFAAFILVITPGPNQLYIIARSASQGRKAGLLSVAGAHTGTLIHVIAASLGLSALLVSSALAFNIVKYIGAAYMVYLGLRVWLSRDDTSDVALQEPEGEARVFIQGMLTNVLNPKVALFFFAFLPQFADTSRGNVAGQILLLGVVLTFIGIGGEAVALLASSAGDWLRRRVKDQRVQKWVMGGVYISLGLSAALASPNRK